MRARLLAEALGTALLLYVVVGSGIAAESLSPDPGVQLFAHATVVGLGLAATIAMFQTVSGSHFNPAVTLGFARTGTIGRTDAVRYVMAQLLGAFTGVAAANLTFAEPLVSISATSRGGLGLVLSEGIATFVLVLLILALVRTGRSAWVPAGVGAWVAAAVFATSSTGFANPAVTVARVFTDSYTGIAPGSVGLFVFGQAAAAFVAAAVARLLYPNDIVERTPA